MIRAMPERKCSFSIEAFPNAVAADDDDKDNSDDDFDDDDADSNNKNRFSRWSSMLKKEEFGGSFQ